MSLLKRPRLSATRSLPYPTEYVKDLNGKYAKFAFDEERAIQLKGQWRAKSFEVAADYPMDLEIGTGNGTHFAHLAKSSPDRALVGIEIKYKPLIQSIRRALGEDSQNARIVRYDASHLDDIFELGELNNVFIHHPDPWPRKRSWKHRLIQDEFLSKLHVLMRAGSYLNFKTDSEDYFDWSMERFRRGPFRLSRETRDLHLSEWQDENFVTQFETIFLRKGQPIFYARLERD